MQLSYKPNFDEVIPRLESLYARRATDRIFATFEMPSPALAQFAGRYTAGYCDEPVVAERIAFWNDLLREPAALTDDSVPSVYLSEFDQGLYGGVLGGEVRFVADPAIGWISSMVPPLMSNRDELDGLRIDRDHPRYRSYLQQLERFVQAADGRFGISHFILIDSLNFVFELIGATATYLALVDDPAWIRRAGDFAFELNVAIHDDFFDRVPLVRGGTCSNMVGWIPGRIVSESVDPFHMTSVDDFRRWGREPIERIFDHFDGGVLHIHGNGRHLLEAVCELPDLKAIFMLDDRGFPPAIDLIEQFRARAGDMPLVVQVDFATFCERLTQRTLPGGVYYRVKGPAEADAANRCMERVRSYRAADG